MMEERTCRQCGKVHLFSNYEQNSICVYCREKNYYASIKEQLQSGDADETCYERKIICPWCGSIQEHDGDYEILYEEGDYTGQQCGMCGKYYTISTEVSYSYSTTREDTP